MKYLLTIALSLLATGIAACAGDAKRNKKEIVAPVEPICYTYVVRNVYPHSDRSYTQGLYFDGGSLWEGTGEYGRSVLQRIDLETGRSEVLARLPHSEFGEGIARLGDRIYQLTWQNNLLHIYDAATFEPIRTLRYAGEGWGLTTDGKSLYLSDGTEYIREMDPETFRQKRRITVTAAGRPVPFLNELEWIDGRIWANVYTTDRIVIIDPVGGAVEGIVDLTGLLPAEAVTPQTDVLNGIAYDAERKRIFVTGKNWSKLFEIQIEKQ